MADPHAHPPAAHGKSAGYETRDMDFRQVVLWGSILAGVVIFSFVFCIWYFRFEVAMINRGRPPAPPLANTDELPPAPRLRVNAVLELVQLREQEQQQLTAYAWVDKNTGIARIPVARAMELVAEHGLPVWAAPAPAPAVDGTNAPPATTNAPPAAAPEAAP